MARLARPPNPTHPRLTTQGIQDPSRPNRLRVALVGAGAIAEMHAAILRKLAGVDLVAVVDTQL